MDRISEVDYGVGSENYKRDWMTEVRRIEGLQAFNTKTNAGAARAAVESLRQLARRAMERVGVRR